MSALAAALLRGLLFDVGKVIVEAEVILVVATVTEGRLEELGIVIFEVLGLSVLVLPVVLEAAGIEVWVAGGFIFNRGMMDVMCLFTIP